jgi:hypothetical protein
MDKENWNLFYKLLKAKLLFTLIVWSAGEVAYKKMVKKLHLKILINFGLVITFGLILAQKTKKSKQGVNVI